MFSDHFDRIAARGPNRVRHSRGGFNPREERLPERALRVGTRYHPFLWRTALSPRPGRASPVCGPRRRGNRRQRSEGDLRHRPVAARALSSTRSHLAARVAPVVDKAEHQGGSWRSHRTHTKCPTCTALHRYSLPAASHTYRTHLCAQLQRSPSLWLSPSTGTWRSSSSGGNGGRSSREEEELPQQRQRQRRLVVAEGRRRCCHR